MVNIGSQAQTDFHFCLNILLVGELFVGKTSIMQCSFDYNANYMSHKISFSRKSPSLKYYQQLSFFHSAFPLTLKYTNVKCVKLKSITLESYYVRQFSYTRNTNESRGEMQVWCVFTGYQEMKGSKEIQKGRALTL